MLQKMYLLLLWSWKMESACCRKWPSSYHEKNIITQDGCHACMLNVMNVNWSLLFCLLFFFSSGFEFSILLALCDFCFTFRSTALVTEASNNIFENYIVLLETRVYVQKALSAKWGPRKTVLSDMGIIAIWNANMRDQTQDTRGG